MRVDEFVMNTSRFKRSKKQLKTCGKCNTTVGIAFQRRQLVPRGLGIRDRGESQTTNHAAGNMKRGKSKTVRSGVDAEKPFGEVQTDPETGSASRTM